MKKRSSRRVAALAVAAVIALGSRETAMAGETSRSLFGVFRDPKNGDVRNEKIREVLTFQDFPYNGPEGNRTPVRKPIPCSSTIIVYCLTFPPVNENRHPFPFSSFILHPHTQSFVYVVSCDSWCR